MTKAEVMARLAEVKDISIYEPDEDEIWVTIEDFEGFDEDWDEIYRDYDDEEIEAMEEWLEENAESHDGDFYAYYNFKGFVVKVGCASMEV